MVTIGKLSQFVPGSESVAVYSKQIKLVANNVPEAKYVGVLLSIFKGPIYGPLCNLVAPDAPSDKSYDELKHIAESFRA